MNTCWLEDTNVAVTKDRPVYLQLAPYHPSEAYPELPCRELSLTDNPAYRSVRRLFKILGYDAKRYNTPDWNPLSVIIKPGSHVILKPNLVADHNHGRWAYGIEDTDCLVTHGSVIRAVLDYVAMALSGHGRITIGDCPIQGTNWDRLLALIGFEEIERYFQRTFPGVVLSIRDYRLGRAKVQAGLVVERIVNEENRDEYLELDLGKESLLVPLMTEGYAFGVSQYPRYRMVAAHTPVTNKYLVHRDFIEADVMVNLPKMKSHMKAGVTCALKNFVGINGHKDYLPHFRFGSPKSNGDEYPDGSLLWHLMWWLYHLDWELEGGFRKRMLIYAARVCGAFDQWLTGRPKGATMLGGGGWYGNDTLWRTILDINRAYFYYNHQCGMLVDDPQPSKRYLAILDGLIGGDKESPLAPSPVASGFMLAAQNPVALDTVATALMGLDYRRIRQIANAYLPMRYPLVAFKPEDIQILGGDVPETIAGIYDQNVFCRFEPSRGYKGAIEYVAEGLDA